MDVNNPHIINLSVIIASCTMSDGEFNQDMQHEMPVRSDGGHVPLDRVFGALSHQRRRYVLYYLRDHEQAHVDDLADQIAAWEREIPTDDVPAETAKRIVTELVHSHLPKLVEYNHVEYDQRSGAVCYTHPPSLLEKIIALAATVEKPE